MSYLKTFLTLVLAVAAATAFAQNPQLQKVWETDSTLKTPESVLFYAPEKVLFVSNIDGKSDEKDLQGSIAKVDLNGKIINPMWAKNLSAPKGMGIYKNNLYVADLTEVAVINLKSGEVTQRIPVEGAIFLNDITVDDAGIVFVSDSRTGKVHRIEGSNVSTYIENKNGVNGLLSEGDGFYLAVKDTLFKMDKSKVFTPITTGMDMSSDGIVRVKKDFIVSCWSGVIYYVKGDGTKTILLDTREKKSNTADIGFDPATSMLYVPTFFKNKVVAYKLTIK